jgi:integrase
MLRALDQLVNGRGFDELAPNDLTLALATYARAHSGSTAHTFAAYVKAYYAWQHEGECPKAIKRVLMVGKPKPNKNVVPLTDAERDQLLETAGSDFYRRRATMRQALIWLLWDSGFRCSEALGLRVGSVIFDDQGGARLVIPADAPELKTGPRTISIS